MLGARVQQMNGWCAELQFAAACDPAPHMRILPSDPGVAALRKGGDMHTGSRAACPMQRWSSPGQQLLPGHA